MHLIINEPSIFKKIINNVHSAVLILDSNKNVIYANSKIGDIFHLKTGANLNSRIKSCLLINCINSQHIKCTGCQLDKAIKTLYATDNDDLTISGEYEFRSAYNKVLYLEFNAVSIMNQDEKLVFLTFNDKTEKRQLYIDIEEAKKEIESKYKQLEIQHFRLKKMANSLENSDSIILAIANSVEAKDPLTNGHIHRVSFYTRKIGEHFCMSADEMEILRKGAILHDIGKIGIPDSILNKPGKLNPEEFEIMKQHTTIGENILLPLTSFREISNIAKHHHEKLDGSGYPDGLKGKEIDIFTRIIAIVDIYDALTAKRPYRDALTNEQAFYILDNEVAKGYQDPEIVDILKKIYNIDLIQERDEIKEQKSFEYKQYSIR